MFLTPTEVSTPTLCAAARHVVFNPNRSVHAMCRCEARVVASQRRLNIVSCPKCKRYVPLRGTCRRFATLSQYCFMSQNPECRLPTEVSTLCAAARNVSSLGNVVSDSIDWGERSSQPILKMDEPVCLKFSRRNFKILRATLEQETAQNHFLDHAALRVWFQLNVRTPQIQIPFLPTIV